jgi:uncharacterized protein
VTDQPFHEGEIALQEAAGSRVRLAEVGPRVMRAFMPEQHRDFFAQLPFVVAGTVDAQGRPWASMLTGRPGFVTSPDPRRLAIAAAALPHDPIAEALVDGAPIGLLGIEPHTRRRNRANGRVVRPGPGGFEVEVDQSFGNCPKYIQSRTAEYAPELAASAPQAHRSDGLDEHARTLIGHADTFFIATAHPLATAAPSRAAGVDVSHRGGKPGFVRIDGDRELTVPDYMGNLYFNTLGNLAINPACGLLFIDFKNGDLLYIAASGRIVPEGPAVEAIAGAQRLMRLQVESVLSIRAALPLRWGPSELSFALAGT